MLLNDILFINKVIITIIFEVNRLKAANYYQIIYNLKISASKIILEKYGPLMEHKLIIKIKNYSFDANMKIKFLFY